MPLKGVFEWTTSRPFNLETYGSWVHLFGAWAVANARSAQEIRNVVNMTAQTVSFSLHSAVWQIIATIPKAEAINELEFSIHGQKLYHILFTKLCVFHEGMLADVLRTCLHGFGHGVIITQMIEALHIGNYDACSPIGSKSILVSQAVVHGSILMCEQGSSIHHAYGCASGVYHAVLIFDARISSSSSDFWPCQQARYPSACLLDYLGVTARPNFLFESSIFPRFHGTLANRYASLRSCLDAGGDERFTRACIWHLSDALAASSGEHPGTWCRRFLTDSNLNALDANESYRWLACIRGITSRNMQSSNTATEITEFCKTLSKGVLPNLSSSIGRSTYGTTNGMCMQAVWKSRLNPLARLDQFRIYDAELFLFER